MSNATRRVVGDLEVRARVAEFWREGVPVGREEKRVKRRIMAVVKVYFVPSERNKERV